MKLSLEKLEEGIILFENQTEDWYQQIYANSYRGFDGKHEYYISALYVARLSFPLLCLLFVFVCMTYVRPPVCSRSPVLCSPYDVFLFSVFLVRRLVKGSLTSVMERCVS